MIFYDSNTITIILISWTFLESSKKQGKEASTNLDLLSRLKNLAIHEN